MKPPLAGLVACYSCCHHVGTSAMWWLRPHKLTQDGAQSCCHAGCAPADSWDEACEHEWGGTARRWGRVGPQSTPFPPVFEHRPIPSAWVQMCFITYSCMQPPCPSPGPIMEKNKSVSEAELWLSLFLKALWVFPLPWTSGFHITVTSAHKLPQEF